MEAPAVSLVLWNVQFRGRNSNAGRELRARIMECAPDIVCITEAEADFLDLPHHLLAGADYGYPHAGSRRKVMLSSRAPWVDVDAIGHDAMPPGRYVAGTTATATGPLRLHGICIPWPHAHVRTGRRDRRPWDEHRKYIAGLAAVLATEDRTTTRVVLGDYNQRIPRRYTPRHVHEELLAAFPPDMVCATSSVVGPLGHAPIDHVHCSSNLEVATMRSLSNIGATGALLSDHFGIHVTLRRRGFPSGR
jgi:endonuclease/exonuclease/phosphatase family metal-dependent hydrolase